MSSYRTFFFTNSPRPAELYKKEEITAIVRGRDQVTGFDDE